MKKYVFFTMICWMSVGYLFSQNSTNMIIYNQEGLKFFVVLNDVKENQKAEANIKLMGLNQTFYKLKIIFADNILGDIDKTLQFNPNTEAVYEIRKDRKGAYVVRWQSEVPLIQAAPPQQGQYVIDLNTPIQPSPGNNVVLQNKPTVQYNMATSPSNENAVVNVNVNVNAPDQNQNVNVSVNDNTPSKAHNNIQLQNNPPASNYNTPTDNQGATVNRREHEHNQDRGYVLPGYNGPIGCNFPINDGDFGNVKQSISSKTFDDTKLTIAKQVINSNCMLTKQVKEIMMLFSFESTRLDLAKYAYGHTYDIGNYYLLNDAFTFDSSIKELNKYIKSFKR